MISRIFSSLAEVSSQHLEWLSDYTLLKYPLAVPLFLLFSIFFIILIKKNFVRFKDAEEKKDYLKRRRLLRYFVMFTRTIIMILLFLALATPFSYEEKTIPGDLSITIMADNSTSFQFYDTGLAGKIKNDLEMSFPVQMRTIAEGDRSPIADSLLSRIRGDDNLLLVTDGQNNYGKSLHDAMLFLGNLNVTINAVYLDPVKSDTGIVVRGPDKAVRGTELTFAARVTQVGDPAPYRVKVTMGNKLMVDETTSGSQSFRFSRKMGEGYHKIEAEVIMLDEAEDFFPENNIYYKTIEIIERPKIFVWSKKESYFYSYLMELFHFSRESSLPDDLSGYAAVMMNDLSINEISSSDYDRLVDFVLNGSGLIVYGGKNSYDHGGYRNSILETILPVNTGSAEPEQVIKENVNVIIVIDISGSTGSYLLGQGGDIKVDVEKSLAISVLDLIKDDSQVGVVAFNTNAYEVWPLSSASSRYDIQQRVGTLISGGGTTISSGINKATEMFKGVSGSNNIILISDGVDGISGSPATSAAEAARRRGITIYAVGVGRDTSDITMKNIAYAGGGYYYKAEQSQRLKIIFGEPEEDETCRADSKEIVIIDPNHFITEGLDVNAVLSGHNFVSPKSTGNVIIATCDGKPVMTSWRYGLGRVVAMSTDDGTGWSGSLLNAENSEIISRMINWALGDPGRNRDFNVDVSDGNIGDPIKITVKSKDMPLSDLVEFKQSADLHYEGYFTPSEAGFYDFFGSLSAVNYRKELEALGFNNDLMGLVKATGGEMFEPGDIKGMIEKTKSVSRRTESVENTMRWPLLAIAMMIFLIEIAVRRIAEMR